MDLSKICSTFMSLRSFTKMVKNRDSDKLLSPIISPHHSFLLIRDLREQGISTTSMNYTYFFFFRPDGQAGLKFKNCDDP